MSPPRGEEELGLGLGLGLEEMEKVEEVVADWERGKPRTR